MNSASNYTYTYMYILRPEQNISYSYVIFTRCFFFLAVPRGSEVKTSASNARDLGLIPGLGRFPGEGNGNPLQYSCLENPMDGGAWQATVHGVAKSQTRLSDFTSLTWHIGSWFSNQWLNPYPLQWKLGVLTTVPPGGGLIFINFKKSNHASLFIFRNMYCKE